MTTLKRPSSYLGTDLFRYTVEIVALT